MLATIDMPIATVNVQDAAGVSALREASHNILYTVANSWMYANGQPEVTPTRGSTSRGSLPVLRSWRCSDSRSSRSVATALARPPLTRPGLIRRTSDGHEAVRIAERD